MVNNSGGGWERVLEAESHMIGEECRNGGTPDLRSYQASRENVVQGAAARVSGPTRVPASEMVAADVLQEMAAVPIENRQVAQVWMARVEVTHVDGSEVCGRRKGSDIQQTWSTVHITHLDAAITYLHFKQLVGSVWVLRVVEESVL